MERYAKVQSSLWSTSKKFKQLTMMQKYIYLYLLTCQHGNSAGIYRLTPAYSAYDCAVTLKEFDSAIIVLSEKYLISFDSKENVVLIHQYMKFNPITNDKHAKGTAKVASEFKESSVYRAWIDEAIPYFKGFESVIDRAIDRAMDSQSIQQSTENREQNTDNRKENINTSLEIIDKKRSQTQKAFDEESFEIQLVDTFIIHLKQRNEKMKEPNRQAWASEVDKLIRIDGRTEEEIVNVLKFAINDSFWQNNILSTAKLRKQFDQLFVKMQKNTSRKEVSTEWNID